MPIADFRQTLQVDPAVNQLHINVVESMNRLTSRHDAGAVVFTVALATGVINLIPHGFGRPAEGYRIVDNADNFALIYRVGNPLAFNIDTSRYLPIVSANAQTVNLEIW